MTSAETEQLIDLTSQLIKTCHQIAIPVAQFLLTSESANSGITDFDVNKLADFQHERELLRRSIDQSSQEYASIAA